MTYVQTPPGPEIDIRSIGALLRRQLRVIAVSAFVIFGLAGLFLLTVTETFTATALILVDPDNRNILEPDAVLPASSGRDNSRIDSEVEILKSDAVALNVIRSRQLAADREFGARLSLPQKLARAVGIANAAPADRRRITAKTLTRFKKATQIRRRGLTYLIAVSATSRRPAKAADLANTLASVYIQQQVQAKISASLIARDVVEGQIDAARQSLAFYSAAYDRLVQLNTAQIDAGADTGADTGRSAGRRADLDVNISELRGEIRRAVLANDLSPQQLTEIYGVQQEISIARTQYDSLLARKRDLETQANIQIANSRVVSAALEPVAPAFPNPGLILLVALGASMGVGVSLAFLNEHYIGGVTSAAQLGELMQAPTAAAIPHVAKRTAGRARVADNIIDAPLSAYSESIRKLRAAIDQNFRVTSPATDGSRLRSGNIILVTSALPDEGKSTTALSLARTYAQAGRKTLLIDADLRKPSIHRQLGFEPRIGFLDYLRNPASTQLAGSFYARDPASTLALIMGAERSEFPTDQLLSSATFEALLAQAKDVYDVVVIDSPPLLPVVDTRYIAHHADAVAVLVKWAATAQNDLRTAVQPLRQAMKPAAVLVPVLSQVQGGAGNFGYGGYYDSYSAAI